jgi:hypothetical protein
VEQTQVQTQQLIQLQTLQQIQQLILQPIQQHQKIKQQIQQTQLNPVIKILEGISNVIQGVENKIKEK